MKPLILFSGGIDSTLCLWLYKNASAKAVGFNYGQPHGVELNHAESLAAKAGVPYKVLTLPVITRKEGEENVFPGRNAVLISMAMQYALQNDCDTLVVGCNKDDWEKFPDCRPEFLIAMNEVLEAYGVRLESPLNYMTKHEIVEEARTLGVPLEETWSCYYPSPEGPCGKCLPCELRRKEGIDDGPNTGTLHEVRGGDL